MNCATGILSNLTKIGICSEKQRLLDGLLAAIRELILTQEQQLRAVITKDPDFARFDILLEMANARKRAAKYEYLKHVEEHEC